MSERLEEGLGDLRSHGTDNCMSLDEQHLNPARQRAKARRTHAALWEAVVIAADSIWSHKLRSFLTLLGVIIGVASVVAVGGAIEGLGYYVNDRLTSVFGSNTFILGRIARMNITAEEWEKLIAWLAGRRPVAARPGEVDALEPKATS